MPDAHVASGRFPGYVGAVRIGGRMATRAAGTTAVESDSPSMTEDTPFRIASITKLIGGALTLSLVEDDESPRQLQRLLDRRRSGEASVSLTH